MGARAGIKRWQWFLWAVLFGIGAALWYHLSRPDPSRRQVELLAPIDLDLVELPDRPLTSPFVGDAVVRGRVSTQDDKPLADIWVRLRVDRITLRETHTDAQGRFLIENLPRGQADLICGGPRYRARMLEDLHLGEEPLEIAIHLRERGHPAAPVEAPAEAGPPDATLIGKCLSGIELPCFYEVSLAPLRPTDPGTRRVLRTDPQGRGFFSFEKIMPGTYTLQVRAARGPGREDIPFGSLTGLVVEPGGVQNISIATPTIILEGRTLASPPDPQHEPQPLAETHLWVFWRGAGAEEVLVEHRRSDEHGNFQLPQMPPGRVRLVASQPGFETVERVLELRSGESKPIEITLARR